MRTGAPPLAPNSSARFEAVLPSFSTRSDIIAAYQRRESRRDSAEEDGGLCNSADDVILPCHCPHLLHAALGEEPSKDRDAGERGRSPLSSSHLVSCLSLSLNFFSSREDVSSGRLRAIAFLPQHSPTAVVGQASRSFPTERIREVCAMATRAQAIGRS